MSDQPPAKHTGNLVQQADQSLQNLQCPTVAKVPVYSKTRGKFSTTTTEAARLAQSVERVTLTDLLLKMSISQGCGFDPRVGLNPQHLHRSIFFDPWTLIFSFCYRVTVDRR